MELDRIIALSNTVTVYRDGDRCVKVFDAHYSAANVLQEALHQAVAMEAGLPVPPVLEVTTLNGHWALVSQLIRGETLRQYIQKNPQKREEGLQLLVRLQLRVLEKTAPRLPRCKEQLVRNIERAPLPEAMRSTLRTRICSVPDGDRLCHGSFDPANIILTPEGEASILGWANASRGCPEADAACTALRLRLQGIDPEQYLRLFGQESGHSREEINAWLPLLAAALTADSSEAQREILKSYIIV